MPLKGLRRRAAPRRGAGGRALGARRCGVAHAHVMSVGNPRALGLQSKSSCNRGGPRGAPRPGRPCQAGAGAGGRQGRRRWMPGSQQGARGVGARVLAGDVCVCVGGGVRARRGSAGCRGCSKGYIPRRGQPGRAYVHGVVCVARGAGARERWVARLHVIWIKLGVSVQNQRPRGPNLQIKGGAAMPEWHVVTSSRNLGSLDSSRKRSVRGMGPATRRGPPRRAA
ncbi:MAG: hypothetical protein J3K34DRAFT_88095 [Monoraphidium minutum]|nr:MAG: hypothetical protein J3K34DRAFT_88095 [Monoraphidium minutum]